MGVGGTLILTYLLCIKCLHCSVYKPYLECVFFSESYLGVGFVQWILPFINRKMLIRKMIIVQYTSGLEWVLFSESYLLLAGKSLSGRWLSSDIAQAWSGYCLVFLTFYSRRCLSSIYHILTYLILRSVLFAIWSWFTCFIYVSIARSINHTWSRGHWQTILDL